MFMMQKSRNFSASSKNTCIGVNLIQMINEIGEAETEKLLSDFSCPLNLDVEHFLKHSAIEFSKQHIASTYLIMISYNNTYVLAGYFTLSNKFFCVCNDSLPSKTWQRRIAKFAQFDANLGKYFLSVPLIGQLSKNFTNDYNTLITGDELLKLALDKVCEIQTLVGGKIVYLECEDISYLKEFYSSNGFVSFGKRKLSQSEYSNTSSVNLIQMLKYIKK